MFIESVLGLATPLILAALGCLLSVRAGVVNMGLEGMMLAGAFTAAAVSHTAGPYPGLVAAGVIGLIMAALLAWSHLVLKADIVLAGIAINLIAAGGTVTALFALTRSADGQGDLRSQPLSPVAMPFVQKIPLLDNFASLSPITWLLLFLMPAFVWMYFNSRQGIWIRAVGGNAPAVIEAGVSPRHVQAKALLISGLLAGVAGAQFSLFTTNIFVRDMVQGRGFIALGAVYLGLRHPVGVILAALTFGFFEALSTFLQVRTTFPTDPILMLPYAVTIVALAVSGIRVLRRGSGVRLV